MRANAEAMRCVAYANAASIDFANSSSDASECEYWTPDGFIDTHFKGWGTDLGVEMTSLGVQTHGGMGYVEETGAAQHWRDVRIAPIYEGTNGIQAADLVSENSPWRSQVMKSSFSTWEICRGPQSRRTSYFDRACSR